MAKALEDGISWLEYVGNGVNMPASLKGSGGLQETQEKHCFDSMAIATRRRVEQQRGHGDCGGVRATT